MFTSRCFIQISACIRLVNQFFLLSSSQTSSLYSPDWLRINLHYSLNNYNIPTIFSRFYLFLENYLMKCVHQNLTYEYKPQAEQEPPLYQDTLFSPGITFTIVHIFIRSLSFMHPSTHFIFIPQHIITYVLIHINTPHFAP